MTKDPRLVSAALKGVYPNVIDLADQSEDDLRKLAFGMLATLISSAADTIDALVKELERRP